jgi:hypothetical protein
MCQIKAYLVRSRCFVSFPRSRLSTGYQNCPSVSCKRSIQTKQTKSREANPTSKAAVSTFRRAYLWWSRWCAPGCRRGAALRRRYFARCRIGALPILGTPYPNGSGVYLENQVRRPAFSLLRVFSLLMSFLRRVERFKSSLQFIQLAYGDLYAALDACKVADYVVFVLSPAVEVGPWGETVLRTLQTQGLPDVVPVVAPGHHIDPKARSGILKSLLSFMQYFFPEQPRVFDLNTISDQVNAVRVLSEGKPRDVRWRQGRPWLLAESVEWTDGNLAVTGIVRGNQLSPNRLVHLSNYGDFQVLRVRCSALLPFFLD